MKKTIILIPVYNDKGDLLKTLNSINEDDDNFEILIIDDGSVIPLTLPREKYKFKINIFRLSENMGITKALNTGLDIISNRKDIDYIARLDAGDIQQPNRITIQKKTFESDSELVMLGTNVKFYDTNHNYLFDTKLPLTDIQIKKEKYIRSCFIHPSVLFTKRNIDQGMRYSTKFPAAEDYEFFLRIILNYKVANLDKSYVYCFDRATGISIRKRNIQINSVLKCLFKHRDYTSTYWYFGVFKVLMQKIFPRKVFNLIKSKQK